MFTVPGEQEPLHATPGAEVERAPGGPPHGEPGQRFARGHDAQHAIGLRRREVACDEQALGWADQAQWTRHRSLHINEAELLEFREPQRGQRRFYLRVGDRRA